MQKIGDLKIIFGVRQPLCKFSKTIQLQVENIPTSFSGLRLLRPCSFNTLLQIHVLASQFQI